ncbi:aspartic proteinase CDR1-like [Papaver somniferum]|uniref:aspartic proteinase CDR1-like n=1 Tax=Papaver somniferum TaxID=3469 RepID=UPI000E6F4988|nr:aspartic proteinase CDR1-like [Papaver somniferum]
MRLAVLKIQQGGLVVGVGLHPIRPVPDAIFIQEDIATPECRDTIRKYMTENGFTGFDLVMHGGGLSSDTRATPWDQASQLTESIKLATEFLSPKGAFVTKIFNGAQDYNPMLYCLEQVRYSSRRASTSFKKEESIPKRVVLASDFVWSETPLEVFGIADSLSFNDDACLSLRGHNLTTRRVKMICKDLRVMDKQHFKHLMKKLHFVRYGDGSYSTGNLAFETLTFDSTSGRSIQLPNIAFGCGHNTATGHFNEKGSGLVGLGGGELSLISQLGSKIDSKFSYCLVPSHDVSSKFIFGSNAEMTGKDVLSTPLISDPFQKTFYYLALEAISVNENKVPFISDTSSTKDTEAFQEDNYIIIDSGTTFTFLPEEMYSDIESEIKKAIQVEPTVGPNGFNLCYPFDDSMTFPEVTVHFTDADIKLDAGNYFVPVGGGFICLSFFPSKTPPYLYGNVAQINFLVEYALTENKVSFKPTDCTKQG